MDHVDVNMTPEERLMRVIFRVEPDTNFLTDSGRQAVNDLLKNVVAAAPIETERVKDEWGYYRIKKYGQAWYERGVRVIRLRFGFEDGRCRTLKEVGEEFKVTRERIRQIESRMLRILCHPARSKRLQQYLPSNLQNGLK